MDGKENNQGVVAGGVCLGLGFRKLDTLVPVYCQRSLSKTTLIAFVIDLSLILSLILFGVRVVQHCMQGWFGPQNLQVGREMKEHCLAAGNYFTE